MSGPVVDRRVTLQWLFGAMVAASLPARAAARTAAPAPVEPAAAGGGAWPDKVPPAITAGGYGTDPDLMAGKVPWPKTLTDAQLETAAALGDTILPGEGAHPPPSKVGVQHFIDEWVSAPYPVQMTDRPLLLNGFAWVDQEAQRRYGRTYAALADAERASVLGDAARTDPKGLLFLQRMKYLTTGAYYTTEAGIAELGYVGNEAIEGDYPGPTPEALAHLDGVLAGLKLSRKGTA